MLKKNERRKEQIIRLKERGVAAAVIMAIDTDGKRGIISSDGQNYAWAATFDSAWRQYINKEMRLAKQNAEETLAADTQSDQE